MNQDGIYLNDTFVAPADGVATTFQGNDLSKPDTMQSSYTNQFTLPDSMAVREFTRNAEQIDSAERFAYEAIPARLIMDGEQVFAGLAELDSFSNGWDTAIYEEKRNLFARLDRSIRTADLARFNHKWVLEDIATRKDAVDGYCYPAIDYGLLSGGELPSDTFFPALFVKTLVGQLLSEEGYTLTGNLPADSMYNELAIPFTEDTPTSKDQQFADDRTSRVTWEGEDDYRDRTAFGKALAIDRIQPFSIDDRPLDSWFQGIKKNFNTATNEYICDTDMRLICESFQQFKLTVWSGTFEIKLIIEKNGTNVYQEYQTFETGHNLLGLRRETIQLKETINCKKGDKIRIRFTAGRLTKVGGYTITVYNNPAATWAAFVPDLTLAIGDTWPMARNLPDITGLALLKSIAFIYGGFWSVDNVRKTIKLVTLSEIVANTTSFVDWSTRIDTGSQPGWSPKLSPYAQTNFLKWKEVDETKKQATIRGKVSVNFGDGIISVNASTLESEATLFELPFSASVNSTEAIPGYGAPVKIETRTIQGGNISNKNAGPRLILVGSGDPVAVGTKRLKEDNVTVEQLTVLLRPCWFSVRPTVLIRPETKYCLCFDAVPGLSGERTLIQNNYQGLIKVLERMRVVTLPMRLWPEDIAGLDFAKPVRIKQIEAGSLVISDQLFYLQKIDQYRPARICKVTLVAY